MSFTKISRQEAQRRITSQGPPKLIVTQASNGRTQINLSAAVRDHLRPAGGFRVSLLIDQASRRLALVRAPDGTIDDNDFEVRGAVNSSMYIFGNAFDQMLGLQPGHYLAELSFMREMGSSPVAFIDLDSRINPDTLPKGAKVHQPSVSATTTPEERLRMATIDSIVNEGVVVVSGRPE